MSERTTWSMAGWRSQMVLSGTKSCDYTASFWTDAAISTAHQRSAAAVACLYHLYMYVSLRLTNGGSSSTKRGWNAPSPLWTFYSVSQKKSLLKFSDIFPNRLRIFSPNFTPYYKFLSTLDYKFLFNYLQLWRSYAILSTTTITWSKCPPSAETHAGWSHLIWHNFVKVADNQAART